jgi:hypothetical protein
MATSSTIEISPMEYTTLAAIVRVNDSYQFATGRAGIARTHRISEAI